MIKRAPRQPGIDHGVSGAARLGIALPAMAALGLSLMLLWVTLQANGGPATLGQGLPGGGGAIGGFASGLGGGGRGVQLPGCGTGVVSCDHVLATRWGYWLGVPVSAFSVATYLVILGALVHVGPLSPPTRSMAAWHVLTVLSVAVIGAAIWFVGLQFYEWRFCVYCLAAHGCGLVTAGLILWAKPRWISSRGSAQTLGVLLLGGLILPQIFIKPAEPTWQELVTRMEAGSDFDTGPGPDRQMSVLGGRVALRPHDYPILGSPDAPYIMVYLFDYTCPFCREMHQQLESVRYQFDQQLAIIPLPVPLDAKCNPSVQRTRSRHENACELARLSLAVWQLDRQVHTSFHDWLMRGPEPPTLEQAQRHARRLVGQQALEAALADPQLDERLARHMTLHRMSNSTVIPMLMVRHLLLLSLPQHEELVSLLEQELGIQRSGT